MVELPTYPLFVSVKSAVANMLQIPQVVKSLLQSIRQSFPTGRKTNAEHNKLHDQQENQKNRILRKIKGFKRTQLSRSPPLKTHTY